MGQLLLISVRD